MRTIACAVFIVGVLLAGPAEAQEPQEPQAPPEQAQPAPPEPPTPPTLMPQEPQAETPQDPRNPRDPQEQAPQLPRAVPPEGSAIFDGASARGLARRPDRLNMVLQAFGGYDDDVLAEQSGRGGVREEGLESTAAGLATGVGVAMNFSQPGLLFRRPGARGDFRLWTDNTFRYYPGLDNLVGRYHRFGLEMSAPVSRRITFFGSPRADYSPRYAFELVPTGMDAGVNELQPELPPDQVVAPGLESSVVSSNALRYTLNAGMAVEFNQRSSLTVDGGYTKRQSDLADYAMEVRNIGISVDHQFTSNAALDLGYSYVDGDHAAGPATRSHNIDVGLDYRRPLSRTRKTFLSFSTGSTVVDSELSGRRFQAIGSARLVHYVKRTWTTHVEYRRRLNYVEGFAEPLFGDVVSTGITGLLSRRMEFVANAGYTSGSVGLVSDAPRFDSFNASVRLRRALTSRLAGYVQGLFYHYAFDETALRPPGLPQTFNRMAIRFGLSMWVPLVH